MKVLHHLYQHAINTLPNYKINKEMIEMIEMVYILLLSPRSKTQRQLLKGENRREK